MTIAAETTILAHAYFRAGLDLRIIEPEVRPKVLRLREKHLPTRACACGGRGGPIDDVSGWQSNAIRELEEFDDGNHQ